MPRWGTGPYMGAKMIKYWETENGQIINNQLTN